MKKCKTSYSNLERILELLFRYSIACVTLCYFGKDALNLKYD